MSDTRATFKAGAAAQANIDQIESMRPDLAGTSAVINAALADERALCEIMEVAHSINALIDALTDWIRNYPHGTWKDRVELWTEAGNENQH